MSTKWRSAHSLGITLPHMQRRIWLIGAVAGVGKAVLQKAVRAKLISRMRDGFLPRRSDFFKLCVFLDLEPDDFIAPESVFIEKLRRFRRKWIAEHK